ncbi:MAG: hypothetical protein U9O94_01340 [Nanoarchaeota archaeon]|nr:hypothetical protein [Nanoarchaeota archaeon]
MKLFQLVNRILPENYRNNRGTWGAIVSAVVGVAGSYMVNKMSSKGGGAPPVSGAYQIDDGRYSPQNQDGYVVNNPSYVSQYMQDTGRASDKFYKKGNNQKYFPGMFAGQRRG